MDKIVICKQCGRPEYWGEMRWLSGKCTCRNCYRANWQDENKALYEWDEGRKAMAEVKIWPRGQNETGGILLMPMKKNIPKGHPEWSLVKCPICGQECWRPMSRQELRQKKMQAACTECGLKIESRRTNP